MSGTNTVPPPDAVEEQAATTTTTNTVPVPVTTSEPVSSEPAPTPVSSPVAAVEADIKSDYDRIAELAQGARAEYLSLKPEMQGRIHQLLNDIESASGVAEGLANFHTLLGEWKK